jgi:HTH-type transcriptional regulator / antitoxin HigA
MSPIADSVAPSPEREHYFELVRKFPLRPIRSDEELMQAIAVIRPLLARALDEGEQDYLDVLSDLVEKYEAEEHPMPPVSDADMLRHLIDARDITQAKLASDLGLPDSTVSEVLAGKRRLTRKHIGAIAKYFGVSPGVFSS